MNVFEMNGSCKNVDAFLNETMKAGNEEKFRQNYCNYSQKLFADPLIGSFGNLTPDNLEQQPYSLTCPYTLKYFDDKHFVDKNGILQNPMIVFDGYSNPINVYDQTHQIISQQYNGFNEQQKTYANISTPKVLNREFGDISFQENHINGIQQRQLQYIFPQHVCSHENQFVSTVDQQKISENPKYFQNSEIEIMPFLPSSIETTTIFADETSVNSINSEASNELPSINQRRKRGRPKSYHTNSDKKAARNIAQKKYAEKIKANLRKLKKEVPNLEKENFELQQRKEALIKACRKMLFHKDLPEIDQKVIGAIIGFQ